MLVDGDGVVAAAGAAEKVVVGVEVEVGDIPNVDGDDLQVTAEAVVNVTVALEGVIEPVVVVGVETLGLDVLLLPFTLLVFGVRPLADFWAFLYAVRHGSEQNSFLPPGKGKMYFRLGFCSRQ